MSKPIKWDLSEIWNHAAVKENKELKERDYAYASELGMPFYDRYLKMKAVPYTNPPNNRSLRKFLAGNIWEHTVKQILIACGVYRHEEMVINATPIPGLIEVHGRCDFIAGGKVDADKAISAVNLLNLPDFLVVVASKIIAAFDGLDLEQRILELKAVSTFAMDKVERTRAAMPNHCLQAYHYQSNGGIPASISYICKDDCRMAQFEVNGAQIAPIYGLDLEKMTFYFKKKKIPPFEPLCTFDDALGKFSKNLGVEYSPYLSHYGFGTPDDYRQSVSFIEKWNRALSRFCLAESGGKTPTGKPIMVTSKNIDVKNEILAAGFDFDKCLAIKMEMGENIEEEIES